MFQYLEYVSCFFFYHNHSALQCGAVGCPSVPVLAGTRCGTFAVLGRTELTRWGALCCSYSAAFVPHEEKTWECQSRPEGSGRHMGCIRTETAGEAAQPCWLKSCYPICSAVGSNQLICPHWRYHLGSFWCKIKIIKISVLISFLLLETILWFHAVYIWNLSIHLQWLSTRCREV